MTMAAPTDMDERLLDEAMAWHLALDADDADWDRYTLWLEADSRHRKAFDAIALTDRIVADHTDRLREILPAVTQPSLPERQSNRPWYFGAAALALAIGITLPMTMMPVADVTYAAGAQPRHIALATGIAVDLGPSSILVAKGGDTKRLELARGEAYFDVAHDPVRVLAVRAGDYSVSDIGTRFGINLSDSAVLVSVAQGQVAVNPQESSAAIRVIAGQQLLARPRGGSAIVTKVSSSNVGSWRSGQLSYSDAPLDVVAADISRYLNKPIDVDAGLADRRFSGVLAIGDGSKLLPTLTQIMALSYRDAGGHIRLSAAPAR